MFHQYCCLSVFMFLLAGSKTILVPKFNFLEMLQIIQDHKVTAIPLVPPIALLLCKHPATNDFDLSSIQTILSSAAPLGADIIVNVKSKFNCSLLQGYGMTECTLATHFTPVDALEKLKAGSIGVVTPFYEAKVTKVLSP